MPRQSREETLLRLLIELSDEEGHCNRELVYKLKIYKERISELFGDLESAGIIYHINRPSTNPNITSERSRYEEKAYYIGPQDPTTSNEKIRVFTWIFEEYVREGNLNLKRKFFESIYVNNLIKEIGYVKIHNIIKTQFHDESLKLF